MRQPPLDQRLVRTPVHASAMVSKAMSRMGFLRGERSIGPLGTIGDFEARVKASLWKAATLSVANTDDRGAVENFGVDRSMIQANALTTAGPSCFSLILRA